MGDINDCELEIKSAANGHGVEIYKGGEIVASLHWLDLEVALQMRAKKHVPSPGNWIIGKSLIDGSIVSSVRSPGRVGYL